MKYAYKVVKVSDNRNLVAIEDELNELGSDEWEALCMNEQMIIMIKVTHEDDFGYEVLKYLDGEE